MSCTLNSKCKSRPKSLPCRCHAIRASGIYARASRCLAAKVVTRTQLLADVFVEWSKDSKNIATQCSYRIGADGVRFEEGCPASQWGGVWRCPLPIFFLFSSSEWSDLVHSAGAIFYSSAACYTPKITELMVLKGDRGDRLVRL